MIADVITRLAIVSTESVALIGVFKGQCQGGPGISVPTNHLYPDAISYVGQHIAERRKFI